MKIRKPDFKNMNSTVLAVIIVLGLIAFCAIGSALIVLFPEVVLGMFALAAVVFIIFLVKMDIDDLRKNNDLMNMPHNEYMRKYHG